MFWRVSLASLGQIFRQSVTMMWRKTGGLFVVIWKFVDIKKRDAIAVKLMERLLKDRVGQYPSC